jgi:8-oxo-dGTP pyrophosphatase MutT (NUDIX family)
MYQNRAVGVVPIDNEDHTWLVGQYRYTHQSYEWEIPEGGCPQDESLEECAARELREETGLVASHYECIAELQLSNSTTDEVAYLFLAKGIQQLEANPEDTEKLQVRRLPLAEAICMAMDGEIRDAMSVAALLKVSVMRGAGFC